MDAQADREPGRRGPGRSGYVQPDMGHNHVDVGDKVTYTYCPPASGSHYNAPGVGPIAPRLYGPADEPCPQGWIHNLEHGAMVILYRGSDGDPGPTEDGQAALRALFDAFPASPVCGIQPGTSQGPVIARFDEMATPYAAIVWDRVLPLDELDTTRDPRLLAGLGRADQPGAAVRGASASAQRQPEAQRAEPEPAPPRARADRDRLECATPPISRARARSSASG